MLVLLHHCEVPLFGGGFYGVDLFFVLSGYLITSLLRGEVTANGRIEVKAFYFRRALRLWPPLILMLSLYGITSPWFFPEADISRDALVAGLYLSDYSFAFWRVPDLIRHTWSLAVEEHFYLIWPAVIAVTAKWDGRRLALLFLSLAIAVTLWRFLQLILFYDWWYRIYFSFDTRSSGLLVGAAIAVMPWRPGGSADLLAGIALAVLAVMVAFVTTRGEFIFGSVVIDAIGGILVLAIAGRPGRVARVLAAAPLVYVGLLSYSIYLLNYPIYRALDHQFGWLATVSIVLPLSVGVSALSFEFIEKPLRALRHRIGGRVVSPA